MLTTCRIMPEGDDAPTQRDIFNDYGKCDRRKVLDDTLDDIRGRSGYGSIKPLFPMTDLCMAKDLCEDV